MFVDIILTLWENEANSLGLVSAASVMVTLFIGAVLLAFEIINPSGRRSTVTVVTETAALSDLGPPPPTVYDQVNLQKNWERPSDNVQPVDAKRNPP